MVQSHVYRMLDVLGNEGVLRLRHCTSLSAPVFSSTGDEAMGCALPSARCCIVSRKLPIAPALRSLDGPSSNGELLTEAETKIDHMAFCTIISNARRRSRGGWCPFWFLLSKHAQSMPSNSENIPRWSLERGGRCALLTLRA